MAETRTEFRQYRRTAIAEMADWYPEFDMEGVSVSAADREAGSPKPGDKIARNPKNHEDKWLVSAEYFRDNFATLSTPREPEVGDWCVCSPESSGKCLACLIERVVRREYGTVGLDYLRKRLYRSPSPYTDEDGREGDGDE